MYTQDHNPELERLRALQESALSTTPHPEVPTWNYHTINRAGSMFGLLIGSWMFLTFLARLLPDFAFIYGILAGAGLLACFYVAIAGHPNLFTLVGITAFGVIIATLLASWDLLLGLFYHQGTALGKVAIVAVGFALSAGLFRVFFNVRRPKAQQQTQVESQQTNSEKAYDAAWQAYLQQWTSQSTDNPS